MSIFFRFLILLIVVIALHIPAAMVGHPEYQEAEEFRQIAILFRAAGMAIFGFLLGGAALIGGRKKPDGGLRAALITSLVVAVLVFVSQYRMAAKDGGLDRYTTKTEGQSVASDEEHTWTTGTCPFEVRFPAPPRRAIKEVPGLGEFESADVQLGRGVFRAECVEVPPSAKAVLGDDSISAIKQVLAENAKRSGIEPIEIEMDTTGAFESGTARGNKMVGGLQVTYITRLAIVGDHMMSTMIGAPSEDFPTDGQMKFINSVSLKSQ